MPLLTVNQLDKTVDNNHILKNIDFQISKGEVIVVIGPSGSGKTTFISNLNFLNNADKGEMNFRDKKIDLSSPKKDDVLWVRRHIAMVFQNYNLFKNKTALENITEGLIHGQGKSKDEANQIALEELKNVGLSEKKDAYPSQLSGGQKQRIGIARATALKPDIILFDEPTSALDPELVGTVVQDMDHLAQQGQTMIVVTHLMSFAKKVATKVLFFADGAILESGTPDQIFNHPKEKRTKEFLSAIAEDR
ncbi:amino acid ABC transporter ATP-binding protein [Lentilactobacillus hilgardii]|uniref:amino acid ABC transporter ATP-binding protein n=1 Tax=Lentilactobacillus hilgardii TaxID=1588 RepID=UPI0021C3019B|nr:amino acid ABC transporter ATP-binding protein [Lentilactobacillus hilgardii]MCP9334174.1 amino acid ABC transporter ATP-binding protein [Lentilactobacillus hilgardii]MCP9350473.1 amino acid ABC transporter ATP-binding protein [Lentilactobacillus hilgardii]MCP9353688.1 amino acid ABC transporter ATP-binding protein [Lentilactobacillus hilgardii]